jgi:bifunctional DNA-binding transcriptional regulator/antitoxin component of YhaV-PrlF toxin-antitoxin module
MTTTVNVSQGGQVELPEGFRKRRKIKPGTALRITEVGNGLYVTPLSEPTEKELHKVIAAAGSLNRSHTTEEQKMVQTAIAEHRKAARRKRG